MTMPTWLFLCFQKIQFTKDEEPRIQISEVILLLYHLRQFLWQFFSSSFFPHVKLCEKGQNPSIREKKKNNKPPIFTSSINCGLQAHRASKLGYSPGRAPLQEGRPGNITYSCINKLKPLHHWSQLQIFSQKKLHYHQVWSCIKWILCLVTFYSKISDVKSACSYSSLPHFSSGKS